MAGKGVENGEFEGMNLRDLIIMQVSDFRNFKKYPWAETSKKVDQMSIVLSEKADKSDIALVVHKQDKMRDQLAAVEALANTNAQRINAVEGDTDDLKKRVSAIETVDTVIQAKKEGIRDVGRFTWGFITKMMAIITFFTTLFGGTVVQIIKAIRDTPTHVEAQANAFADHVHSIIDKMS